jgi:hypothetical protein
MVLFTPRGQAKTSNEHLLAVQSSPVLHGSPPGLASWFGGPVKNEYTVTSAQKLRHQDSQARWLTPIISVTWEAGIRKITVGARRGKKFVNKNLYVEAYTCHPSYTGGHR